MSIQISICILSLFLLSINYLQTITSSASKHTLKINNLIFQIEINFWLSLVYIVNIHCKNLILIFCVSFPFFLYGRSMPFYPVNRFLDIKPFKDLCMLWKYRLGIFSSDFHYIVKSSCPTVDLLTVLPDCIAKVFNMSSATPDSRLIKIRWHPWLIADM